MTTLFTHEDFKENLKKLKEIEEKMKMAKSIKYLGEFSVDMCHTPFYLYSREDWAMYFIQSYGQIDGDHHKTWVLDQVSRILKGTKVIVMKAKWDNDYYEYRVSTGKPSKKYIKWVSEMKGCLNEDDEPEYDYDEGIAP